MEDTKITINLFEAVTTQEADDEVQVNIVDTLTQLCDDFLKQYPDLSDDQRAMLGRLRARIIIELRDFYA